MPVSFPGIIIYLHFSITASQMPDPDSGVARTTGGREGEVEGEGGARGNYPGRCEEAAPCSSM